MYVFLRPILLVLGYLTLAVMYMCCFAYFVWGLKYMKDRGPLYRLLAYTAKAWLLGSGLGWRIRYQAPLNPQQAYVFCANHTSFLDIPSLFLLRASMVFVGKDSLGRIPLFGYMYKRLHITVDRERAKSRYQVLGLAKARLQEGMSLLFFPEGGIRSKEPPQMVRFLEGAFRTAIEAQVAIVPVSILYNWMIMPKYRRPFLKPYHHQVVLEVHAPISTQNMTLKQVPDLIKEVRSQIQKPLESHFPSSFTQADETTRQP